MNRCEPVHFKVSERIGKVSGIFLQPDNAFSQLVLGHGAGAGMQHPFMEAIAQLLAQLGVATFRYQFPYLEEGKKRPDPPPVAQATVRAATQRALSRNPDLPLFAGGKSFGGRMTSSAAAGSQLEQAVGLVFFGFPLHPPGKPSITRADHLKEVNLPMLFLQGTRDTLAQLDLITSLGETLGPKATLKIMEGGDHSFKVLKKQGKTQEQVLEELAHQTRDWMKTIVT